MNSDFEDKNPEQSLSILIQKECGAHIAPEKISALFRTRWPHLSNLAHAIHNKQAIA
jgi:hypothetical protein